jgi:hypothetical protein
MLIARIYRFTNHSLPIHVNWSQSGLHHRVLCARKRALRRDPNNSPDPVKLAVYSTLGHANFLHDYRNAHLQNRTRQATRIH